MLTLQPKNSAATVAPLSARRTTTEGNSRALLDADPTIPAGVIVENLIHQYLASTHAGHCLRVDKT